MSVNGFFRRYWRYFLTLTCSCAVIITAQSCASQSRSGGPGSPLLIITSVTTSSTSANGATIRWNTNRPADSVVEFGPTTSYGNMTSIGTMETSHSVNIFGLTPNTLYHYRVKSKDEAGNLSTSGDQTFKTTEGGSTPRPGPTPIPAPTPDPRDLNELAPYAGPFGEEQARILFERFGFGAPPERIQQAVQDGLETTINKLTTWQEESALDARVADWACDLWLQGDPLNGNEGSCNPSDPYDVKHQTYPDSKLIYFLHSQNQYFYKILFFLHDERLAASDSDGDKYFYRHVYVDHWNMLLRAAKGETSYKQFMGEWMKDGLGHVFWQDGEDNVVTRAGVAGNENFAREFWEIGTVGTTDLDGRPVYTDLDIANAALVHTGYKRAYGKDKRGDYWIGAYDPQLHASGAFDVFVGTPYQARVSTQEQLLEATFNHQRTAQHLAEDIWKEFINPYATPAAIQELANAIRQSQYNLTPVMRTIMRSKALYAPGSKESLIKHPIELVMGFLRSFPGYNTSHISNGDDYTVLMWHTRSLGQAFMAPNTIFGWDEKVLSGASYIKGWRDVVNALLTKTPGSQSNFFAKYNIRTQFLNGVTNTDQLIDKLSSTFNVPLNATQRGHLKTYLDTEPRPCSEDPSNQDCQSGATFYTRASNFFGQASATQQEERIKGAIAILVGQPSYRTK